MTHRPRSYLQPTLCALAVLACELISRPFTTMNVCDDGPYIRTARTFANTGHLVYNGWEGAMVIAQIYLAQPFIKLFGYSYTSVRMSTLLLAVVAAFILQRTVVRTGISERNATLATLAVVISPIYLMFAATFMSDIGGLFAITLCMYGCVRAIQASADRSAVGWICFAAFTCALFGTSRQIAWLGTLVMVPCTLFLLRHRRRVLLGGAVATAIAFLLILGCMLWFSRQPYVIPVPLIVRPFPMHAALRQLSFIVFEIPFLILPLFAIFLPSIFRSRASIRFPLLAMLLAYVVLAFLSRNGPNPDLRLEPTAGNAGSWLTPSGVFTTVPGAPMLLDTGALILLTIVCIGGLLGVVAVVLQLRGAKSSAPRATDGGLSWQQLGILFLPFSAAYFLLLMAAVGTTHTIFDRYAIGLLGPTAIILVRLYQEKIGSRLPRAAVLLVILMAAYGTVVTHNTFALDRARVDLADELHSKGVAFTSIDGGWDYNLDTELDHADYINDPRIKNPADAYVPPPPAASGNCPVFWNERTPHVHAVYGISFLPDTCYGRAPFAPVQYRPWPLRPRLNLYAVRYLPPAK